MKVLLVTDQYIDIRQDGCYCNFALWGTLQNMSVLGELHIIAAKLSADKPAAQPINQKIDFISPDNVKHFKPTTRSIRKYFANSNYNNTILKELIPQMDLVIGYAPGHNLNAALRISKKHKIPFMSFLVASPWDGMRNHRRLIVRLLAPIYFINTRRIIKKSDYVHYVTKEFLQKRYPSSCKSLGCSDTNIVINSTSLDTRLNKIASKTPSDIIKITTIGHIDARFKGQEFVIKSIANIIKEGCPKYHYYLIGAGEGTYLKRLCKQLNIEDNIHFCGRKSLDEVLEILSDSDIYIQPSLTEGLPRSVVEAMSVALPCIGFNVGGIPELLDPEYVIQPKNIDEIIRCIKKLDDLEEYKKVAIRNYGVAKSYEHSTLTTQIRTFFNQIREEIEDGLKQ